MANALHNIICLEAEWEYRYDKRNNKFSLNTEPLLNWLRTFHGCDIVYRTFSTSRTCSIISTISLLIKGSSRNTI